MWAMWRNGPFVCIKNTYQNNIILTSIFVLDPPPENPYISSSSQSFVYTSGNIVNLTCIVHGGNPPANLSWNCISSDLKTDIHSNSTLAASVLFLKVDKKFNNRDCTCIATHPLQTKTKSEKLIVYCEFSTAPILQLSCQLNCL